MKLKTLIPVLLTALGVLLSGVPQAVAQVSDADDIVYPPMPDVDVPQPQRVELGNGMVVMLIEDHELPLIDVTALVRTGSRWEDADKIGLAGLTGQVLRSGGTQNIASDELDDLLEDKAASIESNIGVANGRVTMSTLRGDFPEMLEVLADVLRNPAFEQDKIDVAKTQTTAGIARQNDNPGQIINRECAKLIYGSDSPYARGATYTTIDNISRDDLVAWHAKYFHPNRVILGLVGDFKSAEALELVEKVFGQWPTGPEVEESAVEYRKEPNPGVFYVEKNDMTQSNVCMGHLGIVRDNPDYHAVSLMNQVLGGSFAARLFTRVRSQKGLAYNVRGSVGSQWDYPGVMQLTLNTKTETTAAGIDALLLEANNMIDEPPTVEEVEKARAGILNSFVFRADSTAKILGQQLIYEYYGYPLDWQQRYRQGIETTTTEEVRAAAVKYLHPDRISLLVVGPKEGTDRPLSEFGEVTIVDITIPEPETEAVAETAESLEKGAMLIAKAVEALGGAERIDSVKSLRTEMSMEAHMPQGSMQVKAKVTLALPGRMRQDLVLPFGTRVQVLNGDKSFSQSPQGTKPLPEDARGELESGLRRVPVVLLSHRGDDDFKAVATEAAEVDGTPVVLVHVELGGDTCTLGIDPESGRILRMEHRGENFMGAPGEILELFSDFREVDGLMLPHSTVTTFNGAPMLDATLDSVEVDVEIADSEFEMPE